MIVSMGLYGIAWSMGNKRSARKEAERIENLKASGWLKEKLPVEAEKEEEHREVLTEIPL